MSGRIPRIQTIPEFTLESGGVVRDLRQAYFLDGELNEQRDNLVVIFHALTGSADALGDWWKGVIGRGRAIDTTRYAVLCANLLGSCYGTTARWTSADGPYPRVTTRDLARLSYRLVEELEVESVALATGGSLGGMVALEWAATYPALTRSTAVFAAPAAHTAAAIGWNHIQRRIIAAAGETGLEIARMVAMMTYRTGVEFEQRFGRATEAAGNFQIESYLDNHGRKLRARFDTRSYLALMAAMDSHDVGRGRGGAAPALRRYEGRLIGVGIPGDLLYSEDDVKRWVEAAGAEYREIHSVRGHDAFLLEPDQVAAILDDALSAAPVLPLRATGLR
jgi:homoserine O-acetyltransferase/O-succinyltransferase